MRIVSAQGLRTPIEIVQLALREEDAIEVEVADE